MSTPAGAWEHPNVLTWILRGSNGRAVATVTVKPDGSAFTTVDVNNQAHRQTLPNADAAKAWCESLLANPPQPVAPRSPGPPAPAKPPPIPKGNPVERLLKILHNDPDLAWEVALKAKALGPWTCESADWWSRRDVAGFAVATVRGETTGRTSAAGVMESVTTWRWSEFVPGSSGGEEVMSRGGYADLAVAQAECDDHHRTRGWLLATRSPGGS